jgi:hypothetical protein
MAPGQKKNRSTPRLARGCAFYLSRHHGLVKRHVESVDLNPDHTARWKLQIDLELPTDSAAFLGKRDLEGRCHFLFPLLYLRKTDARTGFEVRDEKGVALTVPIRRECNQISGRAAAEAAASLQSELGVSDGPSADDLNEVMQPIAASTPFQASLTLKALNQQVGLEREEGPPLALQQVEIGQAWRKAGLADVLDMLVENTLVWIPLFGRPGERRSILVTQQVDLIRRTFVRWIFGEMKQPKNHLVHPLRTLRARNTKDDAVLKVGEKRYGLRGRRISLSAMTERIGLPIAWTPCEFEFPTIYTKRCRSYHFELICPPGRTPRDLRPAAGIPIAERGKEAKKTRTKGSLGSRTTLTSNIARHDRSGEGMARNMWFRVSVGVGDGAFPSLWFLTGAITAVMLWLLADNNPVLKNIPAEITTGILLVVPALAAVLAFGGDDDIPVTRLLGGARVLLLITGLSAVAAAAVVAGAKPFGLDANWSWTICAIAATVATVPLGTSWLLSSPLIWSQLRKLRSWHLQRTALNMGVILAAVGIDVLILIGSPSILEGTIAVYLLLLTTGIIALANNRAAMPIGESRRNVVFSLLVVAVTCLSLACVELRAAIDPGPGPQLEVELAALGLVAFSLITAQLKNLPFEKLTAADDDEIHVSPQVGRALLAEEAVAELAMLRRRERKAAEEHDVYVGPEK